MIHTKPPLTKKRSLYPDIFEFARTSIGKRDSMAAILLYTVCPVAARLYLSDIPPMEVPDITTKALVNYVRGGTWKAAIRQSGLERTLPQIKKYIAKIFWWRQRRPGMSFDAELDLLWERDSTMYYFGLQPAMDKLGGSWDSVLEFVRTTAFLLPDWESGMQMRSSEPCRIKLSRRLVVLSAPGLPNNCEIGYPVWCWDVESGDGKRMYIGLLEATGQKNWLRYGLIAHSMLASGAAWPGGRPNIYTLDRRTGIVNYQANMSAAAAVELAAHIFHRMCNGPCFAQAYHDINVCLDGCGYRHICLDEQIPRALPKKPETKFIATLRADKARKKAQRQE